MVFQTLSYNHLLYIGINPALARAHRMRVAVQQYLFAGLLALVVMFSVQAVGVLLVTAMLIVPAAAARNVSRSAGGMFWWAMLVNISSAIAGLIISAQDWARTATGATVILVACGWFLASMIVSALWRKQVLESVTTGFLLCTYFDQIIKEVAFFTIHPPPFGAFVRTPASLPVPG
jgi:zinc transport system permease protein